jgi:hypothetical protein
VVLGNFMDTMANACTARPNVTTDKALFEIKAKNDDLWNADVVSQTTESAPTATGKFCSYPHVLQIRPRWWEEERACSRS